MAKKPLLILITASWLVLSLAGCDGSHLAEVARYQLRSPSENFTEEGDRLAADGRAAEAVLAYRQAVENDPANASALSKLGQAYAAQGRRRLAQRYLQKAQALQPQNPEIVAALSGLVQAQAPTAPLSLAWLAPLGEQVPLGLALAEGRLLVTLESGLVQALNPAGGAVLWQVKLDALTSAPVAGQGLVWVGGQDGSLAALSAADGALRWRFMTGGAVYAAPALSGDWVYCASSDGTLYALGAADGKLRWKFKTGGALHGAPLAADGVVYFGSKDTRLYALDALSGAPRWRYGIATQGPVESQPTLAGGRLFAGSGDSRVYALDPAAGGEYWRYSFPDAIYARPLVVGETVYVASAGQVLAALDALTGTARWEVQARGALSEPPLLLGDALVYAAAGDPNLYAVDWKNGQPLWQIDTGDWISFLVSDGRALYLAGKDGSVFSYFP